MSSGSKHLVGKSAQSKNNLDISFGTFCACLRPSELIDGRFFGYFFNSNIYRDTIQSKSLGVNINNLRREHVESLEFPIPPLNEQKRIVAKIEKLFLTASKSKQILENTETQISKFHNSYLKNIFEDRPNDTEDWNVLPLSQLLKEPLRNGRSGKPTKSKEGTLVLKLTAITDNDFSNSNIKLCNIDKRNLDNLWIKKNDILIERSNSPELVGISAIYEGHDDQFIFPDLIIRVRVNEEQILSKFLSFYLSYGKIRKYFQNRARGISNSFPKISQNDINELKVPFPSISKQKEIIKLIELNFLRINTLHKNKIEISNWLTKLNYSVLKQAFEGKLVPQDPNDEPASELLKIIKSKIN